MGVTTKKKAVKRAKRKKAEQAPPEKPAPAEDVPFRPVLRDDDRTPDWGPSERARRGAAEQAKTNVY